MSTLGIKKGKYKVCPVCGKSFYVLPGQVETRKYCSYDCANEAMKKRTKCICKVCGKEYEVRMSQIRHNGKSCYCSRECQSRGFALFKTGENSPTWKGGVSYENKRIRKGYEWKQWRKSVFERDNYTCYLCSKRSRSAEFIELHPHHIKSYKEFPDLRFDVDNGITLCKECHVNLHKELRRNHQRRPGIHP